LELPPAAIATLLNCPGNAYKPGNSKRRAMQFDFSDARKVATSYLPFREIATSRRSDGTYRLC